MKLITEEERAALVTRPMRRQSPVRTMLMNMNVNDILMVEPKDWTWKTATPAFLCRRVEKETDRRFECEAVLQPPLGWVIRRVG
ncbi:MAG: hypothetical protein K9J06_05695 [Flavobacteriales bacterium]|nr:hypothetical protein [Flavobacteriales bacterium]